MGNSQPKNRTGKKVLAQKLENAKKLGVLSLSEHDLDLIPSELFCDDFQNMRTLDLSRNRISSLSNLGLLKELKSLNLDRNALCAGSLSEVTKLVKIQSLSCSYNMLGVIASVNNAAVSTQQNKKADVAQIVSIPPLPGSLRQLFLAGNRLNIFPENILQSNLPKLETLDLSDNNIAELPDTISDLVGIQELRLDGNNISTLPETMGNMRNLKSLSLKRNSFTVKSTLFGPSNPQPIPDVLFTETPLIDLNLHGNAMSNTQLNEFKGFQEFLERRQKVKSKTMTNLDVCGLD